MKTYLVTGASRGIGNEIVRALAEAGHRVIATARSVEALNELATTYPNHVVALRADLSTDAGCAALAQVGPLDGVAHAAGLLINKPFHNLTDGDWQTMWDVNVMSAVRLARHLSPVFSRGAHLVLIGSMGGVQGTSKYPGLSAYSATKGALSVLTESLATEWGARGISVNCLALGAVQTDMLAQAFPGYQAPVSAERMGAYIATFLTTAGEIHNGKILQVALNNP
jgi:NAD(P)-dependent dehydrogenase (short-subunit alcohol dehydrogenase family)